MSDPFGNTKDLFSVFNETKPQKPKRKHFVAPGEEQDGPSPKKPKTVDTLDLNKQIEESDESDSQLEEDEKVDQSDKQIEKQNDKQNDKQNEKQIEQKKEEDKQKDDKDPESGISWLELQSAREECLHDVALPPNYKGEDPMKMVPPPRKPAKEYSFKLDAFQREAVKAIENNQSVLVSAHTSAGKTAVAEYAIAVALRDGSRVIYTSPIKALSNQKYRELAEEFEDVGLMTGDVTISPNASCLIMTTEILRSMLFRGSEVLNEVAWVIFDEVHYMRDLERGVVWEETLVLLPNTVRYVFLSATIPNALEFAGWVAKLKEQPVHVVYTDYRPTPLQHYVYPSGGDGIHLVVDEKSNFREDNFQKALSVLANPQKLEKKDKKKQEKGSDIYKIVKMIMERKYQPVIIFSFSKRDCEALALQMAKLDFNDEEEKGLVEEVFTNAIDSLSDDDKKLPQVEHMLPLLKRGIGIHHSGLLPIIKEVIEILFQEGLVKALFSTETFAMGLNMPAKTVVFTSIQKFDGKDFRTISSGEYIQMSGRAGRRGIDERGIVITIMNQDIDQKAMRQVLTGKADPLNSSFRLSYYMILNLLRVEEIKPEYIMERSFYQYQSEKSKPEIEKELHRLTELKDKIEIEDEQQVASYAHIRKQLEKAKNVLREEITKPIHALPFIQPGRLVYVRDGQDDWGWGVVVNFQKKKSADSNISSHKASDYIVDVLLHCEPIQTGVKSKPKPCPSGKQGEMVVVPIQLDLIEQISSIRLYLNKNLRTADSKERVRVRLNEIKNRFQEGIPLLDPIEDMKIEGKSLAKTVKKIESLESRLVAHPIHKHPNCAQLYSKFLEKSDLEEQIKAQKKKLKMAGQLVLKEELKRMMRVLRRLGCTNSDNIIQVKGRVACEISTGDELVLTEMMFNGVFNDLTSEQCIALLSCLVYTAKSEDTKLSEELEKPFKKLQEAARRVAKVSEESKIPIDVEEYVNQYCPAMMEVVYAWCKGAKFYEICKMTDIFEGTIVRTMRRLEELARQMCAASKAIGDDNLEKKFLDGITKMKRDIVFSSSLYL